MNGTINFIIFMLLTLNIAPAKALTWAEFLEPFETHHYQVRNRRVHCWKKVTWEEYVPGSGGYRGYVRHHERTHRIHC